eukprot:3228069-Prymnesium_polylepis.2
MDTLSHASPIRTCTEMFIDRVEPPSSLRSGCMASLTEKLPASSSGERSLPMHNQVYIIAATSSGANCCGRCATARGHADRSRPR